MKTCAVKDCKNTQYSKGFCKRHYDKNRRNGNPLYERVLRKDSPCSVPGCSRPFLTNDLCGMHSMRLKRHGDPLFINTKCNRDGNYIKRARVNSSQWKKDNPEVNRSFNKARKTRMRMAVGDASLIQQFYIHCPEGCVVDHIIPINHELVSGLHTFANLQHLSASDNAYKSNKFDGTYENETWQKNKAKAS